MMYTTPWEHIVLDNFFDKNSFFLMKKELNTYLKTAKINNSLTCIEDFSNFPSTYSCLNKNASTYSTFLNSFSCVRPYEQLTIRHQILICLGKFAYRIHDESESKILSIVTYVASNNGRGTRLYNSNKELVKEIEWKENSATIFAGITNKTWHDYYSEQGSYRITVNTFLESK